MQLHLSAIQQLSARSSGIRFDSESHKDTETRSPDFLFSKSFYHRERRERRGFSAFLIFSTPQLLSSVFLIARWFYPLAPCPRLLAQSTAKYSQEAKETQFTHTKTRRHKAQKPQPNLGSRRQATVKDKDLGRNMVGRNIIAASSFCHGYFCQEFGPSV